MNKRERLERTLAGDIGDRIPVSLWRYFPGDDQRAADLAQAIVQFQTDYDWDYVVVPSAMDYMVTGYGLQSEWRGNRDGTRSITKRLVQRSLDWTELRTQNAQRGDLGRQTMCLQLLQERFEPQQIPFMPIIYSPLTQATMLAGHDCVIQHMRTHSDRLRTGLNALTDTTLDYIDSLRRLAISGIIYVIDMASYNLVSEQEYQQFGLPYDQKVWDILPSNWWLNMLQVRGQAPMLRLFEKVNMPLMSWADQTASTKLDRGLGQFRQTINGGLDVDSLYLGTPSTIRSQVRESVRLTGGRRLILGVNDAIMPITPFSNLDAVRNIVREMVV